MRTTMPVIGLCAAALCLAESVSAFLCTSPSILYPSGGCIGERRGLMGGGTLCITMESRGRGEFSGRRREAVGVLLLSALIGISVVPEAAVARGGATRMVAHGMRPVSSPHVPHPMPGSAPPYGGKHVLGAVRGRGSDQSEGRGDPWTDARRDSKGAQGSPSVRKDTCPIKGACAPKEEYARLPL